MVSGLLSGWPTNQRMNEIVMKIKVTELVEDFDLYPRGDVDSTNVTHLVEALEAGAELPPIIADIKTKRIIDGFHRRRAHMRVFGKDCEVDVILKSYKNEAEMLLEAATLNAKHGRSMSNYDRTVAIEKAMRLEIDPQMIATALNMKVERVTAFKVERCSKLENTRRLVPIKTSIRHMRGGTMTKEQAAVVPKLGGNNQSFYVNQLILLIDNDLLNLGNDNLIGQLGTLHDKLGSLLDSLPPRTPRLEPAIVKAHKRTQKVFQASAASAAVLKK